MEQAKVLLEQNFKIINSGVFDAMPRRAQDLTEQKRMLRPQVINLIQWGKHHNNEIGKVLGREENDRLVIEIFQELASEGWFQLAQATMSNFETREIKPEFYELRG